MAPTETGNISYANTSTSKREEQPRQPEQQPQREREQDKQVDSSHSNSNSNSSSNNNSTSNSKVVNTRTASDAPVATMAPFRVKVQKRKRKRSSASSATASASALAGSSSSSSGVSSSSSDEDQDENSNSSPNTTKRSISEAATKGNPSFLQSSSNPSFSGGGGGGGGATSSSSKTSQDPRGVKDTDTSSSSSGMDTDEPQDPRTVGTSKEGTPATAEASKERGGEKKVESENSSSENTTPANSPAKNSAVQQPEGWRVKLYRLNADGSWDDCGTGRIVCVYRSSKRNDTVGSSSTSSSSNSNTTNSSNSHDAAADSVANPEKDAAVDPTTAKPNTENDSGKATAAAAAPAPPTKYSDQWLYEETGEATLCVQAEEKTLLPGANPAHDTGGGKHSNPEEATGGPATNAAAPGATGLTGVDLALSFQDNSGCLDIWRQIAQAQTRASDLLTQMPRANASGGGGVVHKVHLLGGSNEQQRMTGNHNNDGSLSNHNHGNNNHNNHHGSAEESAAQVAAQHHANLQQHELWSRLTDDHGAENEMAYHGSIMEAIQALPNPPSLQSIEEIADTMATLQHMQQRESLAMWICQGDCAYLKDLLGLFPSAEERGDYGKLATLAACVKTILLLNDPSILELIVTVASIFEDVCSCLEYDPDLREKANHRWFLRERAKFRTVVPMEDLEVVSAIHKSFRVTYLRDTLLRPTMDESSLSTLTSMQTFTHTEVVKGVSTPESSRDSYLIRVVRMLGVELHALGVMEWAAMEISPNDAAMTNRGDGELHTDPSIVVGKHSLNTTTWKQYLVPQDTSIASRRLRKRGCLSFLRELFNMVGSSIQLGDKEEFFSLIVSENIELHEEISDNVSQTSQTVEVGSVASTVRSDVGHELQIALENAPPPPPVSLLSLMGNVLADASTDVSEKGAVLEIVAGVAIHDPGLIHRHCLDFQAAWKNEHELEMPGGLELTGRPHPNEMNQAIFWCRPNDLLGSLLFLLNVETDAGVLLQVSEIMRIILDTDLIGDHGPLSPGFADESEGIPPLAGQNLLHEHHHPGGGHASTDQNHFLSMFYDHYVDWLVAPFQFSLFHTARCVPYTVLKTSTESHLLKRIARSYNDCVLQDGPVLKSVVPSSLRSSFAVELLSFCVRAHLYRMKFYLLRSRVLKKVLSLLKPLQNGFRGVNDRCLKLAALRLLRSILTVNDEFYHRHVVQHDLFAPVFEAFRVNPVGDNLVSSAIVEMCNFILKENIKSILDYIVTKHIIASDPGAATPSLEDISSPYVNTLTLLRKAYEDNKNATLNKNNDDEFMQHPQGSRYYPTAPQHHPVRQLTGKALEDQRKFREADNDESYFHSADEEEPPPNTVVPPAVDEVAAQQQHENELHRTPRMFSLAQAPLLSNLDEQKVSTSDDRADMDTSGGDTYMHDQGTAE